MLTVHHLGVSQSERIVWLCEELALEYTLKRYDRRADNQMAPDDYKALHPMGIAPVITDGDLVLGESGAICEYIDRKYGDSRLTPGPDSPDYADHLYWFHAANATVMTLAMMELTMMSAGLGSASIADHRKHQVWTMMDRRVGEKPFFGGARLTTADIMLVWSLTTMRRFIPQPLDTFPNIREYLSRISGRDAYRAAMAKAEPGMEPNLK